MPIKKCRLSQSGRKITELFVGFKKLGTVFETNKRKRLKNFKSENVTFTDSKGLGCSDLILVLVVCGLGNWRGLANHVVHGMTAP